MSTTSGSVSKGCFAFKGKKKNARIGDYLPIVKNHDMNRCFHRFTETWEEVDTQIQILQSDFNCNIFEDLLTFTQNSHAGFSLDDAVLQKTQGEIPAAALVTGVNTPDHSTMFANLVSMLQDRVTPMVAILKSKDCQNVKNILSRTLSQLLDNHCLAEEEDDDDMKSKSLPLTLSTLAKWYRNKHTSQPSSPKKRKSADGTGISKGSYSPIVVVMEDFENFQPRVIQDFIAISSNYVSQLPLVFIFGIATSVSAIHRLLPNEVSSLLCMEKFQAPPSTEYLTLVINQILITSRYPFKVGRGVFQLLLDIFLYYDFSVLNFNQALRFAMLDHFSSQPVSFLCCKLEHVEEIVKGLDKDDLELVRQLPSFRRYVEGCSTKEQPDLLLNEKFTKTHIIKLIEGLNEYHTNFFPVLRCLHTLASKLPGYPLGKQLREVYSIALESNIDDSEDYKQTRDLLKLVLCGSQEQNMIHCVNSGIINNMVWNLQHLRDFSRMLSKDELRGLLLQCSTLLSPETQLDGVHAEIDTYMYKIDHIDELYEEEEPVETAGDTNLPSKTSLHQLRQKLQDISKQKKKLSPYEKLREEIIEYFDTIFRKYIVCPMNLPLHEIFYYNNTRSVKQHLNASPRSSLQMALSNPNYYLQCKCCVNDSGQVLSTMPDTCVVYKLHLECGQLINLYDWMQAFVTVVEPDDEENNPGKPDQTIQARFIQAVSQLQFLGFVKPTKRKTDHVARLTWGGC